MECGYNVWCIAMSEPRWFVIVGLSSDVVGGVLIAATAWLRLSIPGTIVSSLAGVPGAGGWANPSEERSGPLWRRRVLVLVGGGLLAGGFGLQIYGSWLQMALS